MSRERYEALVVDLDGTLIGRDELVSPAVAEAVADISEHLAVSIATGREPADVIRFAGQLGMTAPQISDNGAQILDPTSGSTLWSVPLGQALGEAIVSRLRSNGISLIATYPGGRITGADQPANRSLTRVSALDMEEGAADGLALEFATHPSVAAVKTSLPYNGLWAVDFTRRGVDKGTAARQLTKMLGIESSQMIGVGDSYNDVPLLRACGLRIAMGNAPDELQALADYVAPPVDRDGLATAIREFLLPRLLPML